MDQDWPARNSEFWPIEKITPYARNFRTQSDEQVAQIAASIRESGWTSPVLVDDDGGLIAGHGDDARLQLAEERQPDAGAASCAAPLDLTRRPRGPETHASQDRARSW